VGVLSDSTLSHLQEVADLPDLSGTRYDLMEPIGRGGMGAVYRVRDRELDRDAAMKVLAISDAPPDRLVRLLNEAHILARLEHPGIVPIHEVGRLADGRAFYVMKLVKGRRLDEHVRTLGSLTELLRIFERIAEAVAFAHAHGIVHRDLTPGNVMVGAFGEVLVMDWGAAKIRTPSTPADAVTIDEPRRVAREPVSGSTSPPVTADGTVIGTPGFMAPEQARGDAGAVDHRADVYALGALLARSMAEAPVPKPVPAPLRAVCARAMADRPEDRYASVADLSADLARYIAGLAVAAYPEGMLDRTRRFTRTYRTPILLVVAYLIMRIGFLLFRGF
jgi:eukaryotic-like serine/threonine-protein kinase